MKVTFLVRCLKCGGAERQLAALARGLQARGHSVTVAVFYPSSPLEDELRRAGVLIRSLNKSGRWNMIGFTWRLIRLVRRERPDIVHSYLNVPNILAVLIAVVFPRIRIAWGVRASNVNLSEYEFLAQVLYRVECWLSRFADLIIVNSHAGLGYAATNGFPKNKMVVIPNGIDTVRFRPDRQAGRRARAEWGIREDQKLIGIIGRLDPMKDHATFLKAAALLSQEQKQAIFVCVGSGPEHYKQQLAELSVRLNLADRLIWAGVRADMPAVYNALDVIVSSSCSEGFSNVIGEAMACGVPCVVTDVGDSALIIDKDGEAVPPRNPQAMKAAIAKCLNKSRLDLEEEMSSRQRIIDAFSVKELEARTEAALLRICEGDAC